MAGRFAKVAANLHRHPKIRRGGRAAREVFIWALCCNADEQGEGRVSSAYFDAEYMADVLAMPVDEVTAGLARCIAVGLLARVGDEIVIVGWNAEEWGNPKSGAERTRKWRASRRSKDRDVTASRVVTRYAMTSPDVTGKTFTDQEGPDGGRVTEREGVTSPKVTRVTGDARDVEISLSLTRDRETDQRESQVTDGDARDVTASPSSPVVTPPESANALQLADRLWAEQEELRTSIRAEGVDRDSRGLSPVHPAKTELLHRITECASAGGLERAADDCRHVLQVLGAEARSKRTLRFLDGNHWRADRFGQALVRPVGAGDRAVAGGHYQVTGRDAHVDGEVEL